MQKTVIMIGQLKKIIISICMLATTISTNAQGSGWNVNPYDYPYDMTVYGQLVIDDIMLYRSEVINNVIRILNMDREYNYYKELKKLHSIIDIDIDLITIRKYVGINKSKEVFKEIESLILNNKLNNNRIDIINYLKGRKYE